MKATSHCVGDIGARPWAIMLKRMLLWALGLTIAAFLVLIAYVVVYVTWTFDSSGNSDARREAAIWFQNETAQHTCLTQDALRGIAAKRDWLVESHDEFHWCISRDDLTDWTSVTIEPPLLLSTVDENRRYFGFDAQGCSAEWAYGSC